MGKRYDYSDDIESIVDTKGLANGLGMEVTTFDILFKLNQFESMGRLIAACENSPQAAWALLEELRQGLKFTARSPKVRKEGTRAFRASFDADNVPASP